MYKSGICHTKSAISLSQTYYIVFIGTHIWPNDLWQIWWPSVTCNLRDQGHVQCYRHTLVSELITQGQITVGSSNVVERLTIWPAVYDHWSRSIGQRPRSQGHETYQQLERYNSATEGRINFKLGENFRPEGQNIWYTFWVSRSTRPEVEIWWTFSISNAKNQQRTSSNHQNIVSHKEIGVNESNAGVKF